MKTKHEEKLEGELKQCRLLLRREKQKNADLQKSKEKYKTENKNLRKVVKSQDEALKKNEYRIH